MLFSKQSSAQIALAYNDTTICPGETIQMCAQLTGHASSLNTDDNFSEIVPIGFSFNFFGNNYTKIVASGNGFITFDTTLAWPAGGPWYYGQTPVQERNCIFAAFADWYLPDGGEIRYEHFGTPGQRKFIIEWCNIPAFHGGVCLTQKVITQLILSEGTNIIEIHTTQLPVLTGGCPTATPAPSNRVIQGVENATGTLSYFPVDRGPSGTIPNNWGQVGVTNDARRFTPNTSPGGSMVYEIDTIPFAPWTIIDSLNSADLKWYDPTQPGSPITTGSCATVTPDGNQDYYLVTFQGNAGCLNNLVDLTDTVFIHYGTIYDTLDVNICQGETYNFYGRALNYPGTFDTAFNNPQGCDSFVHLILHVNPLPIATLTDTTAVEYFCKGSLGHLSIAQPSNLYNYQWKRNGMNVPGGTTATLNTEKSGDYQLFVTTLKGCKDSSRIITLNKDSVQIDFKPIPMFGCNTDTVRIINNSEPGIAYEWHFGDGSYPLDTTASPTHIYNQQGTYYIHLIMTDSLGCVDSLTKFVDLSHPLNAGFTVSIDSLCQGEAATVQFTNTSTGAQNYEWHFADGSPVSTQTSPAHDFSLAGSHNVMLVASDSLPCYDTAYHTIYVDSLPFLYIVPEKTSLCIGEKLNLRLNYLPETATTVNWNFGDGINWPQFDSAEHSYDQAGNYMVTVTVDHPVCPPSEDTVSISVHDLPIVNFGPDTTLCLQGSPILLQNLAINAPGTQYRWNTGDSSASLSVVHPGYYTLTATLSDCSTTEGVTINKDCYIDIPNAFTPNGDGQNDYFFPRQYLSKGTTAVILSIYNRWGQKVFETKKANGRGWDGKFNGKDQPTGVYIFQMEVFYLNGRSEKYSGNITLVR